MVDGGLGHATVDVTSVKKGNSVPILLSIFAKCKLFNDYEMVKSVRYIFTRTLWPLPRGKA